MFIVALFIVAMTWKQPTYPSMNEWVKKMWCICVDNGILFSNKKEGNLPVDTTWMEGIMLSEIEKNKYYMIFFICGILNNKKKRTNTKNFLQGTDLWLPKAGSGRGRQNG